MAGEEGLLWLFGSVPAPEPIVAGSIGDPGIPRQIWPGLLSPRAGDLQMYLIFVRPRQAFEPPSRLTSYVAWMRSVGQPCHLPEVGLAVTP